MDFGKYKKALRASTRPTHLRRVVYDPSITDTDVDFPDIENPRMFAGGGAVRIIKRILSADGLRRLAKKEGIPEKDVEKFLSGEYGILKRDQARGVVKRDKDGNIVVQDKYSKKYDPYRKMMEEAMIEKLGRKPNSEGGVVEREAFFQGGDISSDVKKEIRALLKANNVTPNFKDYKFGIPKNHPLHNRVRYINRREDQLAYKAERGKDPEYREKKKKYSKEYYAANKEEVLQKAKDRYADPKVAELKRKYQNEYYLTDAGKEASRRTFNKRMGEIGLFPPGKNYKENVWHDLYRSSIAKDGGRFVINKDSIPNNPPRAKYGGVDWSKDGLYKTVTFTDTETGKNITFNNLQKYLDKTFGKGTYEKALESYEAKDALKDTKIKYKGKEQRLGTVARELYPGEVLSAFEVHHPEGVGKNWWTTQVTFRDANQDLRAIEGDLIRGVNAAKTEAQKQAVIKRQVKKLEKLPGGINLIFEGQTFGKTPTTETILKASAKKFKDTGYTRQINGVAKKLREDASLQKAALTKYPKCANKAEGGDLATCIATNLIKDSEKLKTGNATQKMVASNRFKDILRKGRRAGQTALSAAALPLELGLEGLFIGWDMAVNGVPLDEAVNRNTIVISGAAELLPEGKLKESLGGGLISGPSAERLAIEKATAGNPAAQRYDQAKQALDEYNNLKGQVEQYKTAGVDSLAYQEALQKFNDLEEELTFLGDMDEYRRILTPGSYESNEYKRVMTEQASERTGQAYRDRDLGMNEGLVDPAGVEQARAEEFKDQTEVIYADDETEEDFMNKNRNEFYKFFGEQLNVPGLQPGQSKFADNVIDMQLRNQYKQGLQLFNGIRRQQYAGGGLTRRGFLKLVAGLGTLGVGLKSGLIKLKTTVAKQTLNNAPKGTPDWFAPLVDKIKIEGKDMTDQLATIEREVVTVLDIPVKDKAGDPVLNYDKSPVKDSYTLRENSDTGEVVVSVNSDAGVNGQAVDFSMTPNKISDMTDDGKPIVEPGEFVVIEERAVGRQVGPDDYDIDLDEYVTNDLDDAASDWHSVEEFATGKTDKNAQVKKVQRKKMIEDDPTEDVVSRQGELIDYNQGDDDYYD